MAMTRRPVPTSSRLGLPISRIGQGRAGLLFVLVITAVLLAACGGGDDDANPGTIELRGQEQALQPVDAPGAEAGAETDAADAAQPDELSGSAPSNGSAPSGAEEAADSAAGQAQNGTGSKSGSGSRAGGAAGAGAARVDLPQRATTEGEAVSAAEAVADAPAQLDVERVPRAVVRVEPTARIGNDLTILAFGSGSIIDASGLILTNFHVVDPAIGHDLLIIAITDALDRAPEQRYVAEIAVADPALDLAVLQLVTDLSGAPLKPDTLGLTVLPLGDSDEVRVLDRVLAFGYPDIGDETLTVTAGSISGFLSQVGVQARRAWFKTDTTISFGNSGGAAVNEAGTLVGIPTQGHFDEGGSLASLRPINLALPLIESARRGEREAPSASVAANTSPILDVTFGTALSEDGEVLGTGYTFPAGASRIVYSFRFQGLSDGAAWVDRWFQDGEPIDALSGARPPWSAGRTGEYMTAIENPSGFADGVYTLELVFDGQVLARRSLAVGAATLPGAQVGRVFFARGVAPNGDPLQVETTFPVGLPAIFAFYEYTQADSAAQLTAVWRREGEPEPLVVIGPSPWSGGADGLAWVSLTNDRGVPPGEYTVEIRFDGAVAGRATVRVSAAPASALPDAQPLALGETQSGSVGEGDLVLFRLSGVPVPLPAGQGLLVELRGDGDADLYVRPGAPPDPADLGQRWDTADLQAPFLPGSDETVFFPSTAEGAPAGVSTGVWYVLVVGVQAAEEVMLTARLAGAAESGIATITPGVTATGVLAPGDATDQFTFVLAAGVSVLRVELSGSGDADLYVRIGAPVLDDQVNQQWDGPDILAPYLVGSEEFVEVLLPNAGTWFVRVEGFAVPAEYSLLVSVE